MIARKGSVALTILLFAGCVDNGSTAEDPIGVARQASTVDDAVGAGCSTTSVEGLSLQIVAQANCDAPGAFVSVPLEPNVTFGSAVFAYLEQPAKDAFVTAVTSKPNTTMTINSMLRTVAQQYLLYAWYQAGTCSIALAAAPGTSNHETGLAFDVEEYSTWQSTLEANGFTWFGSADPVHYDYTGAGATNESGTDVKAFQELWNENNPGDMIGEDGIYGPQTEARLRMSPATGFALGATCAPATSGPDVHLAIAVDAPDLFSDHQSSGVPDVFVGDQHTLTMDVFNAGNQAASSVQVGLSVPAPYLASTFYEIESEPAGGSAFAMDPADADPANPQHDNPGKALTLHLGALAPNETKRVLLRVLGGAYSIGVVAAPPAVQFWVEGIPGFYRQSAYGAAPTLSKGQSFQGGVLQIAEPIDVYSHTDWEWNTTRLEGWTPFGGATLSTNGSSLLVGSQKQAGGALGPSTGFEAGAFSKLAIRARRSGGEGDATLAFTTSADPTFDDAKSLPLDVANDGVFHALEVDLSANANWAGTVTQLRLQAFDSGSGSLELDYLRLEAQGGEGGGGGGGSGGGAPTGAQTTGASTSGSGSDGATSSSGGGGETSGGGCGCVVEGRRDAAGGGGVAALLIILMRRRRQSRRFFC